MNRTAPVVLLVIVGVVSSIIAYFAVQEHNKSRADAEFAAFARNHADLVVGGFSQAFFAIRSVGALYSAVDDVSQKQFSDFADPLLESYPTINALGWVPRVTRGEREGFELAVRDLFPGFRITERGEQNELREASDREFSFPILFISPLAGNQAAHGFDLYSNPVRREAIDRALESGRTVSTARISLVQENAQQYSVLLIDPVFDQSAASDGRKTLRGVASAVYRVGDGVEQVLAGVEPAGLNIWLFDRSGKPGNQFLYFHPARGHEATADAETQPAAGARKYVHGFDLGGRRFELILSPVAGRFDAGPGLIAWLALIVGLGFTALLAAYLALVLRHSRELEAGHQALQHQIGEREHAQQRLRKANQKLEILTRKDPLTGIANRRYFDEYFQREWKRAARHSTSLALLLGDVDFFKAYNDSYGHLSGDQCLRKIARVLSDSLERPGDLAARYGGEELALVLPSTSVAGAYEVAERIRLAVAGLALPQENSPVAEVVTISFGCGAVVPTQVGSKDDFIQAVDQALYQAKQQGRNCTVMIRSTD